MKMFFLALLVLFTAARGSPIPTATYALHALLQDQTGTCNELDGCRTKSSIVWTCLVTVLSCTWVSVHPNIPSPDDGKMTIALRRAGIMIGALIAPELVVLWAMQQHIVARRLAKANDGWTTTHGFYALMGGYMLYEGDMPTRTLLPEDPKFNVPRMTKKEIQDKSKANVLSKGFVILQTGWFVTQVVARKAQGLTVTEFEVVTLAFAALNFVMYALWWNKPLDVSCPMRVYEKESGRDGVVEDGNDGGFWKVLRRELTSWRDSLVELWEEHNVFIILVPILKIVWDGEEPFGSSQKRVKTFYAGKISDDEGFRAAVISFAIGAIFGAIHFLAWSYPFLSQRERILWRVSSIAITSIASYAIFFSVVYKLSAQRPWVEPLVDFLGYIFYLLLVAYIACRVILLVLPFMSLRSLPHDAYSTVKWTTFIPHLH